MPNEDQMPNYEKGYCWRCAEYGISTLLTKENRYSDSTCGQLICKECVKNRFFGLPCFACNDTDIWGEMAKNRKPVILTEDNVHQEDGVDIPSRICKECGQKWDEIAEQQNENEESHLDCPYCGMRMKQNIDNLYEFNCDICKKGKATLQFLVIKNSEV